MSLAGRSVVVTGAGGSIGSALCEQIVAQGPRRLCMVGLTESALYRVGKKLGDANGVPLEFVLGSVTDTDLMTETLWGHDVVIHAAAHKHVPLCEQNVCEAVTNNVGGMLSLATAASLSAVEYVVLISSDKAVRPASVMGATKRVAERIVRDFGGRTKFLTVRFGNVLDSDGSVLPLWREQIAKGHALTVTDPACMRYFMEIKDAVGLILSVLQMQPEAGTFVLDMGEPRNIGQMAQALVAQELAASGREIPIHCTGLRPGEKLTEELHFGGPLLPTADPKVFRVDDATEPLPLGAVSVLLELARRRQCDRAKVKLMELAGMPFGFERAA
jgi:FlaA1/EpsC-like NDP-sugar epimerase